MTFQEKAESKKVFPFGPKEVYETLKKSHKGDVFTVLREKNDQGYWDWVGLVEGETEIEQGGKPVAATNTKETVASVKSSFETADERAKKQVYIIRQSCIGHAVEALAATAKPGTAIKVDDILGVAVAFEDHVLGNAVTGPELTLENEDIPY
jgi:hypothetical protein